MDDQQKPNLSQYFNEDAMPAASQFFDEIGTGSASDMVRSINLSGSSEALQTSTVSATNMTVSFTQPRQEVQPPRVKSPQNFATESTTLPDPSTFFETMTATSVQTLHQAMDSLHIKEPQTDPQADRRRDAWIPTEDTKVILQKVQSASPGSFFPERSYLTMPGLVLTQDLPDSLQEAAIKYLGVGEAASRSVLRREHVTRDEGGLRELMRAGYLRAAINLTTTLLGQGGLRPGQPSRHSPRSLQLWLARFALLARLDMNDILKKESEPFGELDKPDMFYQFYPHEYGTRSGTIVPFSLRLLIAEMPMYWGCAHIALDKLYSILAVIRKMLENLSSGKTEDGSERLIDVSDAQESMKLWSAREVRVTHSIVNCALQLKDYRLAIKLLQKLATNSSQSALMRRSLFSAVGRIYIQIGHLLAANQYLMKAKEIRGDEICPMVDVRELVDFSLLEVARGNYSEAYNHLTIAAQCEPNNLMVANNLSIVLLYMGRLKDAIAVLERAVKSDSNISSSLILNLCTLKELQSSNTQSDKLELLRLLCNKTADSLPNVCAALKLA